MSEVKKCWFCGEVIENDNEVYEIDPQDSGPIQYWHVACAEKTGMKKSKDFEEMHEELKNQENLKVNTSETTLISVLKLFSWVTLVCGIIGAIFIWATMATIEVPYYFVSGTHTETNPVGIALGFVSLFQGTLGYVLLQVVCLMANNIIEIHRKI